jgi:hypothetical protein
MKNEKDYVAVITNPNKPTRYKHLKGNNLDSLKADLPVGADSQGDTWAGPFELEM